jgi:hypothetical protein
MSEWVAQLWGVVPCIRFGGRMAVTFLIETDFVTVSAFA